MALVPATLISGLTSAFTAGQSPSTTRSQQAQRITNAYDTYARLAQSCAALPPSLVNTATLQQQLDSAMNATPSTPPQAAQRWANAFQAYWTGALFGATGVVTVVPGTPALQAQLTTIFSTPTSAPVSTIAQKIGTALDTFTKLVVVQDTVIPPPAGCMAPII
jgi:hypothetical protein